MSDLFLLHAFPFDNRMWDEVASDLAKSGWRVFTPDFRGFGSAPSWDGYEPDLKVLADDLIKILDQFGVDKAVFGGCSLGGYVVQQMLLHYPERVAGAIFIDTKASADTAEARSNRLRVAESVEAAESSAAFTRAMMPNLVAATASEDVKERIASLISNANHKGVASLQRAMAIRPDSHKAIAEFRGPVLSIRGELDTIATAEDHEKILQNSQDGIHFTLAGVGHLAPLEAPSETSGKIKDFLQQLIKGSC